MTPWKIFITRFTYVTVIDVQRQYWKYDALSDAYAMIDRDIYMLNLKRYNPDIASFSTVFPETEPINRAICIKPTT